MGIGAIAGYIPLFIVIMGLQVSVMGFGILLYGFASGLFILDIVLSILGIPFGIIGAFIGKAWLKTRKAVWVGGSIGGGLIALLALIFGRGACFMLGGC